MVKEFTKNSLLTKIAILALVFCASNTQAQSIPISGTQGISITLSSSPENPKPNQNTTLSLESSSINIDSSVIRWYVNGDMKKEGVGEKVLIVKTGESGDLLNIMTEITTSDGRFFEQSLDINPSQVDIIVEASSYTPALYKGRAYFVSQGKVKIIAIPDIVINGKKVETKDLNFKWKRNETVLGDSSGAGKNSIKIEGTIPIKDIYIDLDVMDSSGKIIDSESIVLGPNKPQILFYESSSLYGVLSNKAMTADSSLGNKEEIKIVAKPFFFDITSPTTNETKYSWSVNGQSVVLGGNRNEVILKQTGTGKGNIVVKLKIENLFRIFQFAESSFNLQFGQ